MRHQSVESVEDSEEAQRSNVTEAILASALAVCILALGCCWWKQRQSSKGSGVNNPEPEPEPEPNPPTICDIIDSIDSIQRTIQKIQAKQAESPIKKLKMFLCSPGEPKTDLEQAVDAALNGPDCRDVRSLLKSLRVDLSVDLKLDTEAKKRWRLVETMMRAIDQGVPLEPSGRLEETITNWIEERVPQDLKNHPDQVKGTSTGQEDISKADRLTGLAYIQTIYNEDPEAFLKSELLFDYLMGIVKMAGGKGDDLYQMYTGRVEDPIDLTFPILSLMFYELHDRGFDSRQWLATLVKGARELAAQKFQEEGPRAGSYQVIEPVISSLVNRWTDPNQTKQLQSFFTSAFKLRSGTPLPNPAQLYEMLGPQVEFQTLTDWLQRLHTGGGALIDINDPVTKLILQKVGTTHLLNNRPPVKGLPALEAPGLPKNQVESDDDVGVS